MIRAVAGVLAAALIVGGCNRPSAPVTGDDAAAEAGAERKAVADTDAARRDAATRPAEQSPTPPG